MPVTPADLITAARSFSGVQFVHTGRSRYGLDCVGLLLVSAQSLGWLTDFSFHNYSSVVSADLVTDNIGIFCEELARGEDAQGGDVLLFKVVGNPQHVGLLTAIEADGTRFFIHADQSAGRVQESRLAGRWEHRLHKVYRPRYDELNARYLSGVDR